MGSPLPEQIEVAQRSSIDGRKLTFLINTSDRTLQAELPPVHDVYHDQALAGCVTLGPWQVRVLLELRRNVVLARTLSAF